MHLTFKSVSKTYKYSRKPLLSILLDLNVRQEHIKCTCNHPFYVNEKKDFVQAEKLVNSNTLTSAQKEILTVDSVASLEQLENVYDLTVDSTHTYFVGKVGVWVHNSGEKGRSFNPLMSVDDIPEAEEMLESRFGISSSDGQAAGQSLYLSSGNWDPRNGISEQRFMGLMRIERAHVEELRGYQWTAYSYKLHKSMLSHDLTSVEELTKLQAIRGELENLRGNQYKDFALDCFKQTHGFQPSNEAIDVFRCLRN